MAITIKNKLKERNLLRFDQLESGKSYRIEHTVCLPKSFIGSVGICTGSTFTGDAAEYFLVLDGEHLNNTQRNILVTSDDCSQLRFVEINCTIEFEE
ncbi:MAG TPA: hypothetical protein VFM18_15060 [Methanosarcina sp.]|nr:hypothetical protein [Methanosarcina sp.]